MMQAMMQSDDLSPEAKQEIIAWKRKKNAEGENNGNDQKGKKENKDKPENDKKEDNEDNEENDDNEDNQENGGGIDLQIGSSDL